MVRIKTVLGIRILKDTHRHLVLRSTPDIQVHLLEMVDSVKQYSLLYFTIISLQ